jgi:deoxyribose-phosphate aldolase
LSKLTHSGPELAKYIDHTLLKPDATLKDFEAHCFEAATYNFYSVCIPPSIVSLAKKILKNSPVKICTVIGFPLGNNVPATKTFEAKMAIEQGADELDMVINISALKSGDLATVQDDIRSVVRAASGRPVKVILETCYLTDEEKTAACAISLASGASFVKTSTGFGKGGATEHDVSLMFRAVGGKIGVKASGGIRDAETAKKLIALGATRLGTSQSAAIVSAAGESGAAVTKPSNETY